MQHPFEVLAPEYQDLLSKCVIDPGREPELRSRCGVILDRAQTTHGAEWRSVTDATGVPLLWGVPSNEREDSSDYTRSPAQGDRWDRVSVNVPRGLGPYLNWGASAVAAYKIDHLDRVGAANWTWARACYEGELFNGFGPRNHGKHSGYLWAWTNVYTGGKYVSDGVWDPNAHDQQCGMVPMMIMLRRLDPKLTFADSLAMVVFKPPPPIPPPTPVPIGHGGGNDAYDAAWIQTRLILKGADPPIAVDDNFGRETRRAVAAFQARNNLEVDGIVGPRTIAELSK